MVEANKTEEIDVFSDSEEQPKQPADLKAVTDLAAQQVALEKEIAADQELLDAKAERLRIMQETTLPDLMLGMNLKQFELADGSKIKVEDVVRASIPVAVRPQAYEWIVESGNEPLIKKTIEVPVGRDASVLVLNKIVEVAKELGFNAVINEKIEPPTLTAFVKERLAAGASLPEDLFSVYQGRKAVIKQPKERKPK